MEKSLEPTYFFDFGSAAIRELVQTIDGPVLSSKEAAVRLYLQIRDGWRYNPYRISFNLPDYRASAIAVRDNGHCIDKSILYIACLRAMGVPARLRLAKVRNHISVEKLEEKFGTNVMTPHGMVDLFLDGKWLKATPAFNKELCERTNVQPLDFDGENDSIFQQFNKEGNAFMEYLEDYGPFDDVPVDFIRSNMIDNYPQFTSRMGKDGYLDLL